MPKIFREDVKKHKQYWNKQNKWIDKIMVLINSDLNSHMAKAIAGFQMSRLVGQLQVGISMTGNKTEFISMGTTWIIVEADKPKVEHETRILWKTFEPAYNDIMKLRRQQEVDSNSEIRIYENGGDLLKTNATKCIGRDIENAEKSKIWTPAIVSCRMESWLEAEDENILGIVNKAMDTYTTARLGNKQNVLGASVLLSIGIGKLQDKDMQSNFKKKILDRRIAQSVFVYEGDKNISNYRQSARVMGTSKEALQAEISEQARKIISRHAKNKAEFTISKEAVKVLTSYRDLSFRNRQVSQPELLDKELGGRKTKVLKLAGIFAMWDMSVIVEVRHVFEAIAMVSRSTKGLSRYIEAGYGK